MFSVFMSGLYISYPPFIPFQPIQCVKNKFTRYIEFADKGESAINPALRSIQDKFKNHVNRMLEDCTSQAEIDSVKEQMLKRLKRKRDASEDGSLSPRPASLSSPHAIAIPVDVPLSYS
jgi:hypothetical protein